MADGTHRTAEQATTGTTSGDCWLTVTLRPAGGVDAAAASRLGGALAAAASAGHLVVIDLRAATVHDPSAFVNALREPARALAGPSRCLLITRADPLLAALLDSAGIGAAVLRQVDAPYSIDVLGAAQSGLSLAG